MGAETTSVTAAWAVIFIILAAKSGWISKLKTWIESPVKHG